MLTDQETHRLNYRIAFDAMRAYHTSEIEHKKDMITVLNGILLSIITVFAGIFYFILSKDYDYLLLPKEQSVLRIVFCISFIIIPFLYTLVIYELKKTSKEKIIGDNNRYEKFRRECHFERDALGLTVYFRVKKIKDSVIYWEHTQASPSEPAEDRDGTGYKKTNAIISTYSKLIIFIVCYLSAIAIILLVSKASLV